MLRFVFCFVFFFHTSVNLFLGSIFYFICLMCLFVGYYHTIIVIIVTKLVRQLFVIWIGISLNLLLFGKNSYFYIVEISES